MLLCAYHAHVHIKSEICRVWPTSHECKENWKLVSRAIACTFLMLTFLSTTQIGEKLLLIFFFFCSCCRHCLDARSTHVRTVKKEVKFHLVIAFCSHALNHFQESLTVVVVIYCTFECEESTSLNMCEVQSCHMESSRLIEVALALLQKKGKIVNSNLVDKLQSSTWRLRCVWPQTKIGIFTFFATYLILPQNETLCRNIEQQTQRKTVAKIAVNPVFVIFLEKCQTAKLRAEPAAVHESCRKQKSSPPAWAL